MIKLFDLLNEIEIPKNTWLPLSSVDVKDLEADILNLINTAYDPIGGHPNYSSISDIAGSDYEVIDLDDDPDIDAVTVTKERPGGTKHVGMGHDGTRPAKRSSVSHTINQLDILGNYIEASGKMADILKSVDVIQVTDKDTIQRALKGKKIEIFDDGSYTRYLGGKKYTKLMFGKPTI
jgi:hypothetical protein